MRDVANKLDYNSQNYTRQICYITLYSRRKNSRSGSISEISPHEARTSRTSDIAFCQVCSIEYVLKVYVAPQLRQIWLQVYVVIG